MVTAYYFQCTSTSFNNHLINKDRATCAELLSISGLKAKVWRLSSSFPCTHVYLNSSQMAAAHSLTLKCCSVVPSLLGSQNPTLPIPNVITIMCREILCFLFAFKKHVLTCLKGHGYQPNMSNSGKKGGGVWAGRLLQNGTGKLPKPSSCQRVRPVVESSWNCSVSHCCSLACKNMDKF